MRAVVMQGRRLHLAELPDPVPGDGEVLVEVLACGICGSDLHCAQYGAEFNDSIRAAHGTDVLDLDRPIVFGHEFVGRVLAHGPGTTGRVPIGRRVVSVPSLSRPDQPFLGFSGPETPGGYAERMVLSEALLLEVPDHVPTDQAALTEPLAVAYHAVVRADLGPDDVPLVIGCGPVGLALIAVLRTRGAGPVVAADFSAERRRLAESLGADLVVDPARSSPYVEWATIATSSGTEPMPTVAFECVGAPGVIQQIILGAPPGSKIVVAGLCMTSDGFEPAQAVLKELDLRFAFLYTPDEFARTFEHLVDGDFSITPLVTRTIKLDEVPEAFDGLSNSPQDAKVLIDPRR
ncbi:zinc-binding dehydrogenase [Saccharopolyspora oryzae]|uniref:Zinc-binding dehydrogenase n=1 Tax=Saccharopolyspora oryzae TaxID=2997343 RepID=A0ABT4V4D6_9PSEU|nr:zinc-binding dehydrogenase [Saccharopolyspora oryzae]MDA3628799.1 zinc-binding dehydrogenase [Saccharopolyspora oryzae]